MASTRSASSVAVALVYQGRLLRSLRSPVIPSSLKVVAGTFCLASALITSRAERPPFLSFSQLNAIWLVLVGCLLLVGVLADWSRWHEGKARR